MSALETVGTWRLDGGHGCVALGRTGVLDRILPHRRGLRGLPLVDGTFELRDPLHLSAAEIVVALTKITSVRLTLTDFVSLGNHRCTLEAELTTVGMDEVEPSVLAMRGRIIEDGADGLRIALVGLPPAPFGGLLRVGARFVR
ncbi:MAG TPA: hypothetical protein VGX23_24885 [Actinocrinis sp.]|nr:hypothetical protein [Actinocrinis sp.]